MKLELDLLSSKEDNSFSLDRSHHVNAIKVLARKILPSNIFFQEEITADKVNKAKLFLNEALPIIKWSDVKDSIGSVSIILMCKQRYNVANFFYDMVNRWLIPQKKLNIELFFTSDFIFPRLSTEKFTIMEIIISVNKEEIEGILQNKKSFETELRLGIVSDFHANRIREFKGLSNDRKTAMVQEKIGSLMMSKPKEYGKNIFSEMQQFLIMSRDEFKSERDYHHISRIISILYTIRKIIKQNIDIVPDKRYVVLKLIKTRLKDSKGSVKIVLGMLVGLNFVKEHEVFEKRHLIKAVNYFIKDAKAVDKSYFVDKNSRNSIQTCYLEIEKPDNKNFSHDEIKLLKEKLPAYLKGNVEQLLHPVFMPRNEEEIMRNVMTLSHQLKYVHDIPQVIISFDKQTSMDLTFNIIFLRVLKMNDLPLREIIIRSKTLMKLIQDRVKKVGIIRRKYLKEANVFRAQLSSGDYLRDDHTVDINKARRDILNELVRIFGEVRDYNGGMIYKQNEVFTELKSYLADIGKQNEVLLEKFFYSISPVEMSTIIKPQTLKDIFLMLLNAIKREETRIKRNNDILFKKEAKQICIIIPMHESLKKKVVMDEIEKLNFLSSELVSFSLNSHETMYLGYVYLSDNKEKQDLLFHKIQDNLK